ncbi:hypothetical protein FMEXI_11204 [Fusarium mexicanum]|uniref:Uncharacterized protein n=1 Tax=Fusarium mexicanum TaxID=751941 RepID=A0A8H5IHR1_9HYPO|nr:hypothetical protein FMEXI_11204 [Fusarium mexicanum]
MEESVTFRDQTTETLGKVSFVSHANLPSGNQNVLVRPKLYQQAKVHPSQDQSSHYPWFRLAITPEDQALHFFFHHYVVPESGRSPTHPDCHGIIYKRATEAGYLANLINAVGLAGLAYSKNAPTLFNSARQAFSRALRGICAVLVDPIEAASDQMLVAVMLLALYELIDCLQRGLPVPKVLKDLMAEARRNETEQEAPVARLADIVVNLCTTLSSAGECTVDEGILTFHVSRLLSIDADLEGWAQTLPADYGYETRAKQSHLGEAEMFMGRHDAYCSVEFANSWNLQRCARIILHQSIVEAIPNCLPISSSLSILSSFPVSFTDQLSISESIIQESSSDICSSVPYILHSFDVAGKSSDLRAAYVVHLLWPLSVAGTTHTAADTLRYWVISVMENIKEVTGIQKAKRIALTLQR